MAKVLLVDDDTNLSDAVSDWLRSSEHHTVDVIDNGKEASDVMSMIKYDVIILDWDLPGIPGIEVLRNFRQAGGSSPVLMLTGHAALIDKELCFEAGADDYLTKPFHVRELAMRVRAMLRRPSKLASDSLAAGAIKLDPVAYTVTKLGQQITLTKLEFAVLEFFMRHPNEVFSVDALLERVWPLDSERSPEGVRTLIKKLRNKIDVGDKSLIETVHGRGYKLVP